jgi:hypothetical protein
VRLSELLKAWPEVPAPLKVVAAALTHLRDRARNGARVILYEDGSRRVAETSRSRVELVRRGSGWALRFVRYTKTGRDVRVAVLPAGEEVVEELWRAIQEVVEEVPEEVEVPDAVARALWGKARG